MRTTSVLVFVAVSVCVAAIMGVSRTAWATAGCELCADAARCGDKQPLQPPGWLLVVFCQGKDLGASCTHCDGTASLRECVGSGSPNGKVCTYPQQLPSCGDKYEGKCDTYLGIKYCKKDGSKTGTCDNMVACNGDKPVI